MEDWGIQYVLGGTPSAPRTLTNKRSAQETRWLSHNHSRRTDPREILAPPTLVEQISRWLQILDSEVPLTFIKPPSLILPDSALGWAILPREGAIVQWTGGNPDAASKDYAATVTFALDLIPEQYHPQLLRGCGVIDSDLTICTKTETYEYRRIKGQTPDVIFDFLEIRLLPTMSPPALLCAAALEKNYCCLTTAQVACYLALCQPQLQDLGNMVVLQIDIGGDEILDHKGQLWGWPIFRLSARDGIELLGRRAGGENEGQRTYIAFFAR